MSSFAAPIYALYFAHLTPLNCSRDGRLRGTLNRAPRNIQLCPLLHNTCKCSPLLCPFSGLGLSVISEDVTPVVSYKMRRDINLFSVWQRARDEKRARPRSAFVQVAHCRDSQVALFDGYVV